MSILIIDSNGIDIDKTLKVFDRVRGNTKTIDEVYLIFAKEKGVD